MCAHHSARAVCVAALQALSGLTAAIQSPDTLGMFLPGISSALFALAQRPMHRNSAVAVATLRCWTVVLRCTLGDDVNEDVIGSRVSAVSRLLQLASRKPGAGDGDLHADADGAQDAAGRQPGAMPSLQRTEQWVKGAERKLALLISKVVTQLHHHRHHAARCAVVDFAAVTLSR